MNYLFKKRGFTLIELLVVVAIIAILVAFVSANFLGARQRAKDVKKKMELDSVKSALRLYYNDYSSYPGPAATTANDFSGCGTGTPPNQSCASACNGVFASGAGCDTIYMKLLPQASDYAWNYQQRDSAAAVSADDFCIWTAMDNKSDSEIAKSQAKCDSVCGGVVGASDYVVCAD